MPEQPPVVEPTVPTCDPKSELLDQPCFTCLSQSELTALLVTVLAILDGYSMPAQVNQLLKDSACWTCLPDKLLYQTFIANLIEGTEGTLSVGTLVNQSRCLRCANPKQLKAAIAFLLCKVFSTTE